MLSKRTIGIAIASVATASFATGFIGAEQALKQPDGTEIAQPLQPDLYDAAQRVLWHGDIGLNHVNRQVLLARRQSAIAQSRYSNSSNSRMRDRIDFQESYIEESWSISDPVADQTADSTVSDPFDSASDPSSEPYISTADSHLGATPDTLPNGSLAEPVDHEPESSDSATRSADHRSERAADAPSLKPDFVWQGSPGFVKDYIKASAVK